jgi:Kef-type K+ transport system membrane component KefB
MIDSLPAVLAQMPMPELSNGIPAQGKSPPEVFAFILLDIAIILVAARIVGGVFVKIGQPRVVGEIVAGILIGPTILGGNLARADVLATSDVSEFIPGTGAVNDVFPLGAFSFLSAIGNLTLVFFMFLVGLEVQQRFLKGRGRQILMVALAVVAVPVGLGFIVGGILDGSEWKTPATSTTTHALVIGAALAVTAFPVMARILQEKRMIATDMGAIGVGAAAVVTPLMFLVLAGASVSAKGDAAGVPSAVAVKLLYAIGLVAVLFIVIRPFLRSVVLRNFDPEKPLSGEVLAILLFGAIGSGLLADRIGINALNGGFLFGACVPQIEGIGKAVLDRMSDFVIVFLIPIFLAVAGLQTDFGVLTGDLVPGILLFLGAMIVGKWFVGTGIGMGVGLNWKEANTVGVLMNCRGLMILVVAIVAGSFGAMTPEMRVVFALGAIVTTMMTGPLVDVFVPKADTEAERERSISGSIAGLPALTGGPRVVIAPGMAANMAAAAAAARRYVSAEGAKPQFLLASLRGLAPNGDYVGAGLETLEQERSVSGVLGWLRPGAERLAEEGVDAEAVSFESPDPEADLAKLAEDWGATDAIVATDEEAAALEGAGLNVHRVEGVET